MTDQSQAIAPAAPGILQKLAMVRREVGAIEKSRQVSFGGSYKYRGIEDLYEALWPVLDKYGVLAVPNVVQGTQEWDSKEVKDKSGNPKVSTRCKGLMAFTLIDVDTNTSITGSALAEGVDDSDKAAGKAATYGAKNFWFHFLCCPTEDPDAERPDPANYPDAEPKKRGRPAKQESAPQESFVTKEEFKEAATVSIFEVATSLGELKAAWDKVPVEYRTESVVQAKNKRKAQLEASGA